jgi:hypothetical protein
VNSDGRGWKLYPFLKVIDANQGPTAVSGADVQRTQGSITYFVRFSLVFQLHQKLPFLSMVRLTSQLHAAAAVSILSMLIT